MSLTTSVGQLVAEDQTGLLGKHPSWERVPLSDVAEIVNGFPFPSNQFSPEHGFPLLRIRDVMSSVTETRYVGDYEERYVIRHGDLLVGMDGDFNSALWQGGEALLNQRVCKIVVDDAFYNKKLLHYVLPPFLRAINAVTPSVTVKHLSSKTLLEIPLPLPPRIEQDRLVEALDTLVSRLERAEGLLSKNCIELNRYRSSVLRAACEGRLVPTEAELARAERRKPESAPHPHPSRLKIGTNLRVQELPPLASYIPAPGWGAAELDQVVARESTIVYGIIQAGPHQPDGVPYVRPTEMDGGHIYRDSILRTTPEIAAKYSRSALAFGDVILSIVGTIGEVAIVPEWLDGGNLNQSAVRIRVDPAVAEPAYVALALQSPVLTRQYDLLQFGTAVRRLNVIDVRRLRIPLPPLTEQRRIVAEVERRLSVVERLEVAIDANLARAKRLRQAILKRAFEGKLVPQDPRDEPASALLERIRKEREAAGVMEKRKARRKRDG